MKKPIILAGTIVLLMSTKAFSEQTIELETTTIKGNTELPKYLYVVPWQDKEGDRNKERKLRLHNIYGDLFDPVMPENTLMEESIVLPVETIKN